ncbi:UTP--glucose-1-phosphate uridylyltransferase [Euzebya tangerina]|uniref:UTP--glucose-1-phosphate uridylyltransferase n=1 Tax=Euzebya tangerina TaxID=591198 RepID=UPI00196B91E6|nr:UTP--glucose-1-phosphate uridylyltransferase [Euzebya tangerina]
MNASHDPEVTAGQRMREAGVAQAAIDTFVRQLADLRSGGSGQISEGDIEPVETLEDAGGLPNSDDPDLLDATVVIKLNGGLGTSMGMTGPKSLLPVKDGLSFLDITARQLHGQRERMGARLPLILMNSFATRDASLEAVRAVDPGVEGVPRDFLQNRVPKLRADDLEPVDWPANRDLEWAPPGHGDLYAAIQGDGLLARLINAGLRYAFVSNADNLGATLDRAILGWFAGSGAPFAMEVADRTAADRKGGHLARRPDGGLILREIAQTPEADLDSFQDISRHRYFNTNSLWLDLIAMQDLLTERDGELGLPMIVNRKTVDPTDPTSTPVIQLETAMGAAIGVIDGTTAIRVPRSRFLPVKTTNDLLALRSDAYELTAEATVALVRARLDSGRDAAPLVNLDPTHHKLLDDFEARFPAGPPSLVLADSLTINGDVTVGGNVAVHGEAVIDHEGPGPLRIDDGTVLGSVG